MLKNSRRISLCLIFLAIVIFKADGIYADIIATSNVLQRVLMVKFNNSQGTAFTIEVDDRQYLVTAKHLVKKIKNKDKLMIFYDKKWMEIEVKVIEIQEPNYDVAVLAVDLQLSHVYEVVYGLQGIALSQEICILGYPWGFNMDFGDMNNRFPLPFVKGGILSGMYPKSNMMFIDAYNNKGFSGGPVVAIDYNDGKKRRIVGVISGYKNEQNYVFNGAIDTGLKAISNSGLLIAYDIRPAIEAIKKNPIGFIVK
ncbi:MAG: hypothetical protein A2Y03_00515 [Omnitrophica WOR_2 bacterium GWF2_38_59]|nr:MAG: hypothetical protein A2Y03_00515 [Omnitrophica WOR_2 bacterium GWF2_38_59]OGX49539.1 MAG: hypothetical protein A2243_10690 [Omnitrophica WOR_2 bacterium RIFOXYA2_FULL_38_17]OGX58735.1 MAG: hypothetical protein A2306_12315 [Omnitrophica WOR_2 bacterium RIFOXYB2_FULL_38_16]HBG62155.1 hypothetical protein [Candidatus Omnitrophota bacterium]